jgi:hypothetical protein
VVAVNPEFFFILRYLSGRYGNIFMGRGGG